MAENIVQFHSTAEVARRAGIHKDTLLRWLRGGSVVEPRRDRNGWRSFTEDEALAVLQHAKSEGPSQVVVDPGESEAIVNLRKIDWDFRGAKTSYLTHSMHPYPAKFIPQIPNALIQELSSVGDTVGDIFCGSGTTLVEALTLKRHAVGIDANPLACLISRAKTSAITEADASALSDLCREAKELGVETAQNSRDSLLDTAAFSSTGWRPELQRLTFWFEDHCIEELAEIRARCMGIESVAAREVALVAMSSIVVAVSRQDSDTRYVRREKGIEPGETFKKFARALEQHIRSATELTELIEPRFRCDVHQGSLLEMPDIGALDLVVCSPPYPNAYSYHLYHMSRMLWLSMDQPKFKKEEIGSHRKYSSKSKAAATVETFRAEFEAIMRWLGGQLKVGGYACFVVGDSTLRGERVNNADVISGAAAQAGFVEVSRLTRTMQSSKKSFNPALGRIKAEDILILKNTGATIDE